VPVWVLLARARVVQLARRVGRGSCQSKRSMKKRPKIRRLYFRAARSLSHEVLDVLLCASSSCLELRPTTRARTVKIKSATFWKNEQLEAMVRPFPPRPQARARRRVSKRRGLIGRPSSKTAYRGERANSGSSNASDVRNCAGIKPHNARRTVRKTGARLEKSSPKAKPKHSLSNGSGVLPRPPHGHVRIHGEFRRVT